MEQGYDMELFGEIGSLLLDHNEGGADFTSFYSADTKNTGLISPALPNDTLPYVADASVLDNLLTEGNLLLDQLIVDNGAQLAHTVVDLAEVDELGAQNAHPAIKDYNMADQSLIDLMNQLESDDVSPVASPLSTLPSESSPASPGFFELGNMEPVEQDSLHNMLVELMGGEEMQSPADFQPLSPAGSGYSQSSDDSMFNSSYEQPAVAIEAKPIKRERKTPYSKLPSGRKERKKQQNKEAANRYRAKKKMEQISFAEQEEGLKVRNQALKTEVLNLEREISCLKELLSDIYNVTSL